MKPLEKEFSFYKANQKDILKVYNGKHLIIIGEEIKGAFDTEAESYAYAVENYELGNFLLMHCTPGDEAYTVEFYSPRAIFA